MKITTKKIHLTDVITKRSSPVADSTPIASIQFKYNILSISQKDFTFLGMVNQFCKFYISSEQNILAFKLLNKLEAEKLGSNWRPCLLQKQTNQFKASIAPYLRSLKTAKYKDETYRFEIKKYVSNEGLIKDEFYYVELNSPLVSGTGAEIQGTKKQKQGYSELTEEKVSNSSDDREGTNEPDLNRGVFLG